MTVKRIVANLKCESLDEMRRFYMALFDLDVVMDLGWIVTLAGASPAPVQISVASEGGAGAPMPELSIEVNDVNAAHARAVGLGLAIVRPLTDEPWGVRRFFLRDPAGNLLNVLSHRD